MTDKYDKKTLTEVLKRRPDYYTDKRENKSLMIWTERIVAMMKEQDEK